MSGPDTIDAAAFREHTTLRSGPRGSYALDDDRAFLAVAALGLTGEAGEVADEIKKVLRHGKPLDPEKILNEVGDLLFYADKLLAALGFTLDDAMRANIVKLAARYPDGFENADRKFGFTAEEGA